MKDPTVPNKDDLTFMAVSRSGAVDALPPPPLMSQNLQNLQNLLESYRRQVSIFKVKLKTAATFVDTRHRCQTHDGGIKGTRAPPARRQQARRAEPGKRARARALSRRLLLLSAGGRLRGDGCLSVCLSPLMFVIQQDAAPPPPLPPPTPPPRPPYSPGADEM